MSDDEEIIEINSAQALRASETDNGARAGGTKSPRPPRPKAPGPYRNRMTPHSPNCCLKFSKTSGILLVPVQDVPTGAVGENHSHQRCQSQLDGNLIYKPTPLKCEGIFGVPCFCKCVPHHSRWHPEKEQYYTMNWVSVGSANMPSCNCSKVTLRVSLNDQGPSRKRTRSEESSDISFMNSDTEDDTEYVSSEQDTDLKPMAVDDEPYEPFGANDR